MICNTQAHSEAIAYVALGANLGNPIETVKAAIAALAMIPEAHLLVVSSLYRTAPVGLKNQPDFINAVAALRVPDSLDPRRLLNALFDIETRFGRQRSTPNAARTLDLDLLLHGETMIDESQLTLPHPRIHQRAFVLAPLLEIAPDCYIPGHGMARDLFDACRDQSIRKLADNSEY